VILNAVDLFSGCGGLSEGLKEAGFRVVAGIEVERNAARTYTMNHKDTVLFEEDIRKFDTERIKCLLQGEPLHLLAGCPPCQGFSSLRTLHRKLVIRDERNELILEYFRFVKALKPLTIMLENVPGLVDYTLFKKVIGDLKHIGYTLSYNIVDFAGYGVPQHRKRLVLVGSRIGMIKIAPGTNNAKTVGDVIRNLKPPSDIDDPLHKIFQEHTTRIRDMISLIPKNGGSRKDLPVKYKLKCHSRKNVGFNDIYGRLSWDKVSSTITGGCLSPSKGRFLHPEEDRCISAREAALLQTFPIDYKFPTDIPRTELALLIGNALPPEFSRIQAENIFRHIEGCI